MMPFSFPAGFARRMERLLGEEWSRIAAAYEEPLRRGLRVNTLKFTPEQLKEQLPLPLTPAPFAPMRFCGRRLEGGGGSSITPGHTICRSPPLCQR